LSIHPNIGERKILGSYAILVIALAFLFGRRQRGYAEARRGKEKGGLPYDVSFM
jgi:hypothetical protein